MSAPTSAITRQQIITALSRELRRQRGPDLFVYLDDLNVAMEDGNVTVDGRIDLHAIADAILSEPQ